MSDKIQKRHNSIKVFNYLYREKRVIILYKHATLKLATFHNVQVILYIICIYRYSLNKTVHGVKGIESRAHRITKDLSIIDIFFK